MAKQLLINKIEQLEKQLDIHWEFWGPNCDEVIKLKAEIYECNVQLLNLMTQE